MHCGGIEVPLPDGVRLHAEQLIYRFCQTAAPPGMRPDYRLEFRTRGSSITLYESRPSWVPSIGRWLRIPMVQLRFDPKQGNWTLYKADPNRRWSTWDLVQPSPDLAELLRHVHVCAAGIIVG
ncbi:DUF3024 domain-containing protein [Symbiobacterium terraclitae]|uniref:DUF3024 domain-containing protein n=1 Tax=Symbiobacterium terraclitae TaxID=557451 RepID=UPI004042EB9A